MSKKPTLMDRYMSEYILLGGEIMTRREGQVMLRSEGHNARCIDVFCFGARKLSEQDLRQALYTSLVLLLRGRVMELRTL